MTIPVLLASGIACAGPHKTIRLDKTKSFPIVQQQAAKAVLEEIKAKGQNPINLFAEVHQESDGSLLFLQWGADNHRLLQSNKPVNPGGGLQVKVDPQSGKILETLFWQWSIA